MYLIDLTHTSHCRAQTGVQRVSRCLYAEISQRIPVQPICYDRFAKFWRPLNDDEMAILEMPRNVTPHSSRGQKWSLSQRGRGYLERLCRHGSPLAGRRYAGLIAPEIFSDSVGDAYEQLRPILDGPMVAVCHDLLAVTHPSLTTQGAVARFPQYLKQLQAFDGIAANSQHTRDSLLDYWYRENPMELPSITSIPLGWDLENADNHALPSFKKPMRILCVGTLEARKNHLTLLEAAEKLWNRGLDFELHLVGMVNLETGSKAMRRVIAMEKAGRPVKWHGAISESRLREEYRKAHFTVYPSVAEGFGLPVAESMQFGRACVTSQHGALAELANGGGCLTVDTSSASSLASGIARLLNDLDLLTTMSREALNRTPRNWVQYADDILNWMVELSDVTPLTSHKNSEASIANIA